MEVVARLCLGHLDLDTERGCLSEAHFCSCQRCQDMGHHGVHVPVLCCNIFSFANRCLKGGGYVSISDFVSSTRSLSVGIASEVMVWGKLFSLFDAGIPSLFLGGRLATGNEQQIL